MNISILDEMPKDRIPIITKVVDEHRLKKVYSFDPIPNEIGTALGMTSIINNTRFFILPGIPVEY